MILPLLKAKEETFRNFREVIVHHLFGFVYYAFGIHLSSSHKEKIYFGNCGESVIIICHGDTLIHLEVLLNTLEIF